MNPRCDRACRWSERNGIPCRITGMSMTTRGQGSAKSMWFNQFSQASRMATRLLRLSCGWGPECAFVVRTRLVVLPIPEFRASPSGRARPGGFGRAFIPSVELIGACCSTCCCSRRCRSRVAGSAPRRKPMSSTRASPVTGTRRCRSRCRAAKRGRCMSMSQVFRTSVHGNKLGCTDCHQDMQVGPARVAAVQDAARLHGRVLRAVQALPFRQLHEDARQRALQGARAAATARRPCASTATARTTSTPPHKPSAHVSQTCARCHQGVSTSTRRASTAGSIDRRTTTCPSAPTATARTTSPGRADGQLAEAHAGALRQLPREQDADGEVRPVDRRGEDLRRRLPRHDRVAPARRDAARGERRRAVHRLPRRARHHEGRRAGLARAAREPGQDLRALPPGRERELPGRLDVALRAELGEGAAGLRRPALLRQSSSRS